VTKTLHESGENQYPWILVTRKTPNRHLQEWQSCRRYATFIPFHSGKHATYAIFELLASIIPGKPKSTSLRLERAPQAEQCIAWCQSLWETMSSAVFQDDILLHSAIRSRLNCRHVRVQQISGRQLSRMKRCPHCL
jgi:hypothetical protein